MIPSSVQCVKRSGITAATAGIQSLAVRELPYPMGAATKKKKENIAYLKVTVRGEGCVNSRDSGNK